MCFKFCFKENYGYFGRTVGKLWRRRISVDGLYNNSRDRESELNVEKWELICDENERNMRA